MDLSVVILNYNVRYFLELCLHSVKAATASIDAEIIVVDNNSADDSCNMVKQLFPEVILIENKENLGFSKGNNQGVAIAKGDYVCILNPDTVVSEDVFFKLLEFSKTKENLGIVGCKLIDGSGMFLPESKRNIPVVKVALQKIRGNSANYYANHVQENEVAKVEILVGAFMFMKRTVYNQLKGFDEDYFMYGEDIDLSYKAIKAGFNNYYVGTTAMIHYKGESTLKDTNYAKRFYGAMQIFYKKHFKSNIVFDVFVWLGINLAYLFRKNPNKVKKVSKNMYAFSNMKAQFLSEKLNKKVLVINSISDINDQSTVVFDPSSMRYKEIVSNMIYLSKKKDISFRILMNNSNFIIGSDSSNNRGEVITF
ncbi:glycosyltransferase family 2 protein [Pontimicrobium aquaticum]|uniref:Glycosyltransferase family 2 protein n=1 Tax=Pontimicrobium aquaticum TaxID=2565367 RepID=A0A4U0ENC6_9FLAO|nr:glycosyltransferase family 2 protein [Pontimicrobium aquaticum]TJY32948.1 glycosyltransferase family 2 protein [Pontimicrobium aquaticum]